MTDFIGEMWYDGSKKKSLAEKINDAVKYYYQKDGIVANIVHINPIHYDPAVKVDGIEIISDSYMLPNHLWFGVKETEK